MDILLKNFFSRKWFSLANWEGVVGGDGGTGGKEGDITY